MAFTPEEVVDRRGILLLISNSTAYYVNSGNILDLRDLVMDLLAVKNRLRSNDLEDLTVERFLTNHQTVSETGVVEGLLYWVFGKSDSEQVLLTAFSTPEFPELDPVIHLLCYLYVTGIRSGYLFPSNAFFKQMAKGAFDGNVSIENRYVKEDYQARYKAVSHLAVPRSQKRKVGSHSNS